MSETALVIGMAIAFLIGAYVRKPFEIHFKKKQQPIETPKEKEGKPSIDQQWKNLLFGDKDED